MAKYGQGKYITFKYGRYGALSKAIGKLVRYRISGVVNQSQQIEGISTAKVRIRSNSSGFVVMQTTTIEGNYNKLRVRSDLSQWMYSQRVTLEEMLDGKMT